MIILDGKDRTAWKALRVLHEKMVHVYSSSDQNIGIGRGLVWQAVCIE